MKLAAGAFLVSLAGTLAVGWATIGSPGNFGVDTIDQMQTGQAPTAGCALVGTIAGGIAAIGGGPLAGVRTGAGVSNATCAAANFAISAAGPLTTLILATCVLIGVVLVATALVGFANLGKPGSKDTPGGLIGRFAAGVLLTNIYWLMDVASQSLGMAGVRDLTTLGTQAQGILSYSASTANPVQHLATVCGLALVALVPFGVWSFAKGVLMMRDAVEQRAQVSVGQGVTFVVGGVCLANMNALLPMVLSTFGAPGGLYC